MEDTGDIGQQLDKLDAGRTILEKLLAAASSLESLRIGLESSLQLGQQLGDLPVEALQLYHALGGKIRAMKNEEVLKHLKGLDLKVQKSLQGIMPLVEVFDDIILSANNTIDILTLAEKVDKFGRLAKTAITLRVLLYKRGIETEPLQLSVPEATVRERLSEVESQEQRYREEVNETIGMLESDIKVLLDNPQCSDSMQQVLKAALWDLASNRDHINQGLSLQALPASMELIELSNNNNKTTKEGRIKKIQKPLKTSRPIDADTPEEVVPPKLRWWQQLHDWVNQPWDMNRTKKKPDKPD